MKTDPENQATEQKPQESGEATAKPDGAWCQLGKNQPFLPADLVPHQSKLLGEQSLDWVSGPLLSQELLCRGQTALPSGWPCMVITAVPCAH